MNTLDRYIAKTFYRGFFLVVLVLVTLFSFAALVEEINDVGKGDYQFSDAAIYVLLTIPRRFFDLSPVSALLGALFSLGGLAAGSELIAMRSIGSSVVRVAFAAMKAGIPIVILMIVAAQWVGPKYERQARSLKTNATSGGEAFVDGERTWIKNDRQFIRGTLVVGRPPSDLVILEFDEEKRLHRYLVAKEANPHPDGDWNLIDVQETLVTDRGNLRRVHAELPWQSDLEISELDKVSLVPDTLPPSELIREISRRKEGGLASETHALALWYMISRPLSFLAMLLFAVPFAFGSLRDSGLGRRILLGAIIGVLAYLLDQISGFAGLVFTVHPAFTALGPPALVGFIAIWMLISSD